jgi:DNA mismatch repair ATPase MutS
MQVDWQTLQDLGLLYPAGKRASVFAWVNTTRTQGGEQRLRERFRRPLSGVEEIRETQRAVRFLGEHHWLLEPLLVGSAWVAVEQYARTFYTAVDHPNPLFRWLDSWWLRLMSRDVFDPVRAGLAASRTMVRLAGEALDGLRALGPPPLLAAWMDEVASLLAAPSVAALAGGREVHARFAPQVMAADHRLRAEEFAPLLALAKRVYEVDALCSLARATREHGLVFPEVLDGATPRVEADGLRHPLLDHPVANPLLVAHGSRLLFLTGPNMAGKSTYLKSAGIAVFMAQLGMGVPAASFRWTPFGCLFAGIDTTDNVRLGQSYFFREVGRVREIAEVLAGGTTAFVLFDELFKGTNLKDAADACLAVLSGFSGCAGSAFVVASHLAELAGPVGALDGVAFARFGAEVQDGEPVFRYQLEPGVSDQRLGMLILRRERVLDLLDGLRARAPGGVEPPAGAPPG